MSQMRIEKLVIKGLNQFRNLHLDFRDPATGQPLEKVCFIGPNGTGKTTLLEVLRRFSSMKMGFAASAFPEPFLAASVVIGAERFVLAGPDEFSRIGLSRASGHRMVFRGSIEADPEWIRLIEADPYEPPSDAIATQLKGRFAIIEKDFDAFRPAIELRKDGTQLAVASFTDSGSRLEGKLPKTTLDEALKFARSWKPMRFVGIEDAAGFWNVLIHQIQRRVENWQKFLQQPENRSKTVADAEAEFERTHPEILAEIAKLWARILDKAGLEFDYKAAKRPTQLTDNLEAFIRVKSTGQVIQDYNVLSSGMRNFLFRLGHIYALYFNRKIERGFLFVDEPEDSLYPDFLYDLIDIYLDIIKGQNTQFFVATHNPIIAAQFRPEERFILNFDESHHVVATRGVSPEGDDPNDILDKDFAVANLYGKVGLAKWHRFVELRQQIEGESDRTKKLQLASEYMTIGNAYNFSPDEIPNGHALSQ